MEDGVTLSPFNSTSASEDVAISNIESSTVIESIQCGQMTKTELNLWLNVQYYTEGVCFSIVGAVGFIGNIISIGILHTKDMRKHSFNQMLIGLAFFDLFFILCGVPVHITPIFNLENRLYAWLYAYFLYPFTAVSLTGSIYMTMAITIERFLAVCRPHYYRDVNTRISPVKKVLMYAIPVSTFAIIVNIPKFLETTVHYDEDGVVRYHVTDLRLNPTYIWWYTISYICHPLLTTTVGPFCVLSVLNYKIYKGIKKARTHVSSSNRHGEMNLARVLVTICVVFLVCNSLRLFLGLQAIINVNKTIQCVSINKAWIPPGWMLIMESVSHLLLLISSSSNFLIYCTISTKFKIYIKRNFFWRSSPVVDVPEVNSRIALRTIGKSINEDIRANSGALPSHGSASAQANQNCIEMRPMIPPSLPVTLRGEQETEGTKVMEMELMEDTDAAKKNVVVVAVETISPSLGEDKTDQRCVSRSSTVTGSTGSTSRSKTYDQGSDTSDDQGKMEPLRKETEEDRDQSKKKIPETDSLTETKNIDKTMLEKTDYHLNVLASRKNSIHSLVATNTQETIEEELEDDSSQTESEPETEFSSRI